jgi:hypothetical protein
LLLALVAAGGAGCDGGGSEAALQDAKAASNARWASAAAEFGEGFAEASKAEANSEPRDPGTNDVVPVSYDQEPTDF